MAERSWSEVWTESVAPEIVTFDCLQFPLDWKEDMKKLANKVAGRIKGYRCEHRRGPSCGRRGRRGELRL